jgi:glycosyltransferase involved in cell wall biosynthesis
MGSPGTQPLRILHAPRNIASQASDAVAALRRRGHHAEVWESRSDVPEGADRMLDLSRDGGGASAMAAIADAVDGFDVIHFHFGRTLSGRVLPPYWDLPVLRALGKRVYFTYHGSEIRLARVFRERNPWADLFGGVEALDDDRTEKALQVMRTYANRLFVVSVNYLDYVPDAEYLPRILDLAAWPERPPCQNERPVIVHAPSERGTKGSDIILAALESLRDEGVAFDLQLLDGVPHGVIHDVLSRADMVIDNVIAGSYGIISLEAMASGMVAVSNMSEALRSAHPDAPVVPIDPDTIVETLRRLIRDRGERQALAERGRTFVRAVHDADRIAERLEAAYRAPVTPVSDRAMPDWVSLAPLRRIETLQARVDRLEAELGRTLRREGELRVRLGLSATDPGPFALRAARRMIPDPVRRRIAGRRSGR